MAQLDTRNSANPLDATMTPTQVSRRRFKSSLPRRIENRLISKLGAIARVFELFDRLGEEMKGAGADRSNAQVGLMYTQPNTKGQEHVLARTIALDASGAHGFGLFCEAVMALDEPLFLGALFYQHDPDADSPTQRHILFVAQFMASPEANGRMLAARDEAASAGLFSIRGL